MLVIFAVPLNLVLQWKLLVKKCLLRHHFKRIWQLLLHKNAVHQKLLKETAANSPDQGSGIQNIASTSDEGACGGHAPPPPVRRSSATKQPPIVPPHRSSNGKDGTSWNVFTESNDGADAHAQLMRALNARLDALQRDEEMTLPDRLPPPPPPLKEASLEIPPRQTSLRSAPTKKLPRTPDKICSLEMKLISNKFHTAPRPLETTKAQRRISQPTFSELLDQFPRNRNTSEDAAPLKRLPPTPDRRSSLDLEHANAQRGLVFEVANAQRNMIFEATSKRVVGTNPNEAASRVQKWLAGRGSVDVSRCHADLLERYEEV
ncbi:WH2 domain-containing protein [Caerostris extrusa]|uniref:WH2 domain-containing protein n=1 Tax=Caerostris extrusa TaxID=172846 RepID=A0AAV4XN48_CAEEX|nr:WH2 domain-containing protein [Caerostris extrusa]